MLFQAVMEFCLDLLRSKFWLIGEWSIVSHILSFVNFAVYNFKIKYVILSMNVRG
jgi:hypothetical protein